MHCTWYLNLGEIIAIRRIQQAQEAIKNIAIGFHLMGNWAMLCCCRVVYSGEFFYDPGGQKQRSAAATQLPQALRATICSNQALGRRANLPSAQISAALSVRCAAPRPGDFRASRLPPTSPSGAVAVQASALGNGGKQLCRKSHNCDFPRDNNRFVYVIQVGCQRIQFAGAIHLVNHDVPSLHQCVEWFEKRA
jgi:hypothetical protein